MVAISFSRQRARRRERAIADYFAMWVTRDFDKLDSLVAPGCRYEEYTGMIYRNRTQVHQWIEDALDKQIVTHWRIHDFLHGRGNQGQPQITVTWTFRGCDKAEGAKPYEFDGASIIEFDRQNKINHIREFRAKHERTYPFGAVPR